MPPRSPAGRLPAMTVTLAFGFACALGACSSNEQSSGSGAGQGGGGMSGWGGTGAGFTGGTGGRASCNGGEIDCGGSCVDTQLDPLNCGACGNACGAGEACLGGACSPSCTPDCTGRVCGDDKCGGTCGACDAGQGCQYGQCVNTCTPACGPNQSCQAGGTCVDLGVFWVFIEGGTFSMGSDAPEADADEQPVHDVTVPSFEITKTEITVGQYKDCVDAGACEVPDKTGGICVWGQWYEWGFDVPVTCAWGKGYCAWIGGRLASEAEWEFAARNRGQNVKYPWGNSTDFVTYASLGYDKVCSSPAGNTDQGLCDMSGDVWEFVLDSYHSTYEGAPTDGSPWLGAPGIVARGGVLTDGTAPVPARTTARKKGFKQEVHGFRCARSVLP